MTTTLTTLPTMDKPEAVRDYFRAQILRTKTGDDFEAKDGSGIQIVNAAYGSVVSTVSYVRHNDPSGRVFHVNIMRKA